MSNIEVMEKTLASRGSGKPDYQAESFRTYSWKRFQVKGNEQFKIFQVCWSAIPSPFPHIFPPLGAGLAQNLIDVSTGLPMPFTIQVGVEMEVLDYFLGTDQRIQMSMDLEGFRAVEFTNLADVVQNFSSVKEVSTCDYDPGCLLPHLLTVTATNLSAGNMVGYAKLLTIQREHGTERSDTKTVRCKWCSHEEDVSTETTELICPKCGETTLFTIYRWGGKK